MNTVFVNAEREDTVVFSVRLRCGCMKARDENLARGERELMVDAGAHPQSLHSTFFFFFKSAESWLHFVAPVPPFCLSILPYSSLLSHPIYLPFSFSVTITALASPPSPFLFFFFTCGSQNLCVCFFFLPSRSPSPVVRRHLVTFASVTRRGQQQQKRKRKIGVRVCVCVHLCSALTSSVTRGNQLPFRSPLFFLPTQKTLT